MKHKMLLLARSICAMGAIGVIASPLPALAQAPTAMDKKGSMEMKHSTMPGMATGGDMQDSMKGMMKHMESTKMSGDMDRDFATMMKMHHQGAIDMAEMELKSGKDAKMRSMAKKIIKDQQKEIRKFDDWLAGRK